jgi:hypothetical protein
MVLYIKPLRRINQMIDPEGLLWHNLACSVFNIKGDDGNE